MRDDRGRQPGATNRDLPRVAAVMDHLIYHDCHDQGCTRLKPHPCHDGGCRLTEGEQDIAQAHIPWAEYPWAHVLHR